MKRLLPYLVPLLSVLIIVFYLAFSKPAVVGYAVLVPELTAKITLLTSEKDFLPENTTVSVYFKNQVASMSAKDFILKSGKKSNYTYGANTILGYEGMGFSGNYSYALPLSDFELNRSVENGKYNLSVKIVYDKIIISEKIQEFTVS